VSRIPQSGSLDIVAQARVIDVWRIPDFGHNVPDQFVAIDIFLKYSFSETERKFRKIIRG
jgi:hypothetical protein